MAKIMVSQLLHPFLNKGQSSLCRTDQVCYMVASLSLTHWENHGGSGCAVAAYLIFATMDVLATGTVDSTRAPKEE
jgi:hypothetical protein